jgi:BlaI family penicillinase repressor
MPHDVQPTRLELAILRVLWDSGPLTVRDIQAVLNRAKPTGYTTVLKMLQIMTEKGLVARDEDVRPQRYRPQQPQEQMQRQLLRDFIQRAYGGSVKSLVMHALSGRRSTAKELEQIEKLLERFEGGAK